MASYLLDTPAVLYYLAGSAELGAEARTVLDDVASGLEEANIPACVLAELVLLAERHPGTVDVNAIVATLQTSPGFNFSSLTPDLPLRTRGLGVLKSFHERLLVAQALEEGLSIVTPSPTIAASGLVPVIW